MKTLVGLLATCTPMLLAAALFVGASTTTQAGDTSSAALVISTLSVVGERSLPQSHSHRLELAATAARRTHCDTWHQVCLAGCEENPGYYSVAGCQEQVCGERLNYCLHYGCYRFRTQPHQCDDQGYQE